LRAGHRHPHPVVPVCQSPGRSLRSGPGRWVTRSACTEIARPVKVLEAVEPGLAGDLKERLAG
jgi:hypothetical protein